HRQCFLHQAGCRGGLARIVLRDVPNDDVGIEADHLPEPARAIASFIASMVTGLAGLEIKPFRWRTSRVAATTLYVPFPSATNSTLSPAATPRASRTSFGRVIWPLLVIVAVGIPYYKVRNMSLSRRVVWVSSPDAPHPHGRSPDPHHSHDRRP